MKLNSVDALNEKKSVCCVRQIQYTIIGSRNVNVE